MSPLLSSQAASTLTDLLECAALNDSTSLLLVWDSFASPIYFYCHFLEVSAPDRFFVDVLGWS